MKARLVACSVLALVLAGQAMAGDEDVCATAANLVHAEFPAPHVAAAIARKDLRVLVVGTTSSMIGGPNSTSKAYPIRLQEDLRVAHVAGIHHAGQRAAVVAHVDVETDRVVLAVVDRAQQEQCEQPVRESSASGCEQAARASVRAGSESKCASR